VKTVQMPLDKDLVKAVDQISNVKWFLDKSDIILFFKIMISLMKTVRIDIGFLQAGLRWQMEGHG
jgi:hypothetical protein